MSASAPEQTPAVPAPVSDGGVVATPASANAAPATAQANVASDSLTCQWANCGERCNSPEQLYDHVCERHVGRKSTNNLNLTCQWGNCRTTTVKRDHITSHIRVHVPLKPHKCEFCGKAFKRPQDLKKHVKTHADDSVLLRSPEPNRAQHGPGYASGPGKVGADLRALAATASGYYPDGALGQTGYSHHSQPNAAAFYGSAPPNSAYGPVYYAVNPAANSMTNDYEVRKRAAYDALNEFFGDVKRRQIDPSTYYDVGQRLAGLSSAPLPVHGNYNEYQGAGTMVASAGHHQSGHHYSLPLPALRTKSDLLGVDSFLDQLQSTVYENPNHLAAAGVAQPGIHQYHSGLNYRSSNSPPTQVHVSQPASSHQHSSAPATETPALTPASSVLSYNSHSPSSVHSSHTISPTTRQNMGSMYPTLPSVSAMSDMSNAYPATSSAPPSGLGGAFRADGARRYSGGLLQKAAPAHDSQPSDAMDTSSDSGSTKTSRRSSITGDRDGLRHEVNKLNISSSSVPLDPSLRSPSAQSAGSNDNMSDQQQELWVENIRTIEKIRSYIKQRLEAGEFDDSEDDGSRTPTGSKPEPSDEQSLYPVLKAVQEGRE
ncbi:hypothetical protein EJ05DRAFT_500459 [Pseudovirgaria hyperparasitica]|uniref:C2H2-type domain-containing protein n=1 Tax=Pseudovirgaria hyperparasitica TaxID=470096 RepID=A0A6A6W4T0_9PEZI|nr:uncharacterized protein EJ05DRAFT_500459 [Pseudovirgaria hyperparasitica]KAF2757938.1 hypothetical protein EJ05DRAFT_500459 [Pseudovirgaria hyperparasitica]